MLLAAPSAPAALVPPSSHCESITRSCWMRSAEHPDAAASSATPCSSRRSGTGAEAMLLLLLLSAAKCNSRAGQRTLTSKPVHTGGMGRYNKSTICKTQ